MMEYKVIIEFQIEFPRTTILFNKNTKWTYVGAVDNNIRLHRDCVFVDITKEQLGRYFKEI